MILVVVRIQDPDLQMTLSFCEESPKAEVDNMWQAVTLLHCQKWSTLYTRQSV